MRYLASFPKNSCFFSSLRFSSSSSSSSSLFSFSCRLYSVFFVLYVSVVYSYPSLFGSDCNITVAHAPLMGPSSSFFLSFSLSLSHSLILSRSFPFIFRFSLSLSVVSLCIHIIRYSDLIFRLSPKLKRNTIFSKKEFLLPEHERKKNDNIECFTE